MGRRRLKDKNLPERVYIDYGKRRRNGSWPKPKYYLKKTNNTRIPLGNSEIEMRRNHLALIDRPKNVEKMGDLIDAYLLEISPKKEQSTYEHDLVKAKFLKEFFKDFYPHEVTPQDIYEYMDIRSQKSKIEIEENGKKKIKVVGGEVAANRERSLLSNILSLGIRKGLVKDNVCRHVRPFGEKARDRYPEDWELKAVYNEATDILKCIIDFAYLSGQRIGDLLKITESDITDEGIKISQSKTKNKIAVKLLIEWSNELRNCVTKARSLRGNIRGFHLFCKDNGQPYRYSGFRSMYRRAIDKALKIGILKEKFNFHDLRAKTYSDDDNDQQRIKRAGHVDAAMAKVYDRKFKKVKPLK